MNQIDSVPIDNNVFNRQQSTYDSSATIAYNNEQLIAVWLHTAATTKHQNYESIKAKIENDLDLLRNCIDDLKSCEEYIRNQPQNMKIFFIISNEYSDIILENVHNLGVLHSIYIHDENPNKKNVKTYSKVMNIYTDLNKLIDELSSVVYSYSRRAQLPITILKERYEQDQTTNLLNKFAYFMDFWNPLFIDLLFDLSQTDYEQQKAKFIEQCRIYYRANETRLKNIDDFEVNYTPELAIQWYKRDSFLYRLLNKVMRQQNIQGILTFYFLILDLFKQLNKIYHEYIDINEYIDNTYDDVYRGQLIFVNELDYLKKNLTQGTIISVNSFFSASRDRDVALKFSGAFPIGQNTANFSQETKPVLFQIRINYDHKNQLKRKPFADVSYLSDIDRRDELEIIFMIGSFFHIDDICNFEKEVLVDQKIEKVLVTLIKLTLINEDDVNIPIMKDFRVLKSTKTIQGKVIRIGNLLIDHSLSIRSLRSKADTYYQALYNEPQLKMSCACLTGQAWIALKREQYDLSIKLALYALSSDDKSNDELTITILNCLGGVYAKLKNYPEALKYYNEAYDISKPTDEKIAKQTYKGPCIPIDKYAMYDNYRNISSINIACIYQKKGDSQLAWNMYKEAVDCEMRDTNIFHCHTCMFIAESGTHEMITTSQEHNRIWMNWKSFLDLGLVDMLKYRTPAVTGYFSLTIRYDYLSCRYNNDHCRMMAIDYFRKVESQCEPYVSNKHYYHYTLQCYERLATLYQYWDNRSIDYYEKMIKLCLEYNPNDLESLIIGYRGMRKIYERRLSERSDNQENVSILLYDKNHDMTVVLNSALLTSASTPLSLTMSESLFQNIKPLHFAFDFYDKSIDSRLKTEPDLSKKIIYCHMKLAALYNEQQKTDVAKKSLIEAKRLCQQYGSEMFNVIRICDENLSYIGKNFDFIIQSYKKRLPPVINFVGHCIDEDNYCYIAHLYKKTDDSNSVDEFMKESIKYFEEYDYICFHTMDCYINLAEYYQNIKNDQQSAIDTYQKMIQLMKKHRPDTMIKMISIIEDHLINYFKNTANLETAILIYRKLSDCIRDETTDISVLYSRCERFLQLLIRKYGASNGIIDTYDAFLNLILQVINPLSSQITRVLTDFRDHSINTFKKFNEFISVIEIYKNLLNLLLKHQTDTIEIIKEYKRIAAEFKTKHLFEESILVYENLLNFAYQHYSTGGFIEDDLIHFVFYVWKYDIIKQYSIDRNFDEIINLYYKMIFIIINYRENVNKQYQLNEFIPETIEIYDEIAKIYLSEKNNFDETMKIYQTEIEFHTTYEVQSVQTQINKIFSKCQLFAKEHNEQAIQIYSKLITFIEKNRLNYLSDFSIVYRELDQLNHHHNKQYQILYSVEQNNFVHYSPNLSRVEDINQRIIDYKLKSKRYYHNKQFNKAIDVYKKEILPFLLENHARDDEQIATSYKQIASLYYRIEKNALQALNYYQKAIEIYEKQEENFYKEYSFQLNPNVCRRYANTLFMCYNFKANIYNYLNDNISEQACKQKAREIFEKHKDQFEFCADPLTNMINIQIRTFVQLDF